MDGPAPCRCNEPNPECRRAGVAMTGHLWSLCRGVDCPPNKSERFRRLWDGLPMIPRDDSSAAAPPPAAPAVRRAASSRRRLELVCDHLNPAVSSYCPHGDRLNDAHWCDLLDRAVTRRGHCQDCEHHTAPRPGDTRHLLYYVYPVHGNSVWQCNVDQLRERLTLFNGVRVCMIARQKGVVNHRREHRGQRPPHAVDPPELVRERLAGCGVEFMEMQNNGLIGEAAALAPLLERVSGYTGPGDATFYAHAKGVTRPVNRGVSVHPWTSLLYGANLDHWPAVRRVLEEYPIAGAFKILGPATGYPGLVHYSGTFFWFRNADVFSRNWRAVPQVWGGAEAWPGVLFAPGEAGCVFHGESVGPTVTGYDFPRLRVVMDEYARWCEVQARAGGYRADPRPWLKHHGYE